MVGKGAAESVYRQAATDCVATRPPTQATTVWASDVAVIGVQANGANITKMRAKDEPANPGGLMPRQMENYVQGG